MGGIVDLRWEPLWSNCCLCRWYLILSTIWTLKIKQLPCTHFTAFSKKQCWNTVTLVDYPLLPVEPLCSPVWTVLNSYTLMHLLSNQHVHSVKSNDIFFPLSLKKWVPSPSLTELSFATETLGVFEWGYCDANVQCRRSRPGKTAEHLTWDFKVMVIYLSNNPTTLAHFKH